MEPDVRHLYAVLRQWAIEGKPRTYTQLSNSYHALTGIWFEPHGSWDAPLGELNELLALAGAPALSALVVLQETSEPGDGFWGSASNVPLRPRKDIDRLSEWSRIAAAVIKHPWPSSLP